MRSIWIIVAVSIAVSVIGSSVIAEVPKKISFQGYVSSLSGNPLQGNHTFTFRLYDSEKGTTLLWHEDADTLVVDHGQFH